MALSAVRNFFDRFYSPLIDFFRPFVAAGVSFLITLDFDLDIELHPLWKDVFLFSTLYFSSICLDAFDFKKDENYRGSNFGFQVSGDRRLSLYVNRITRSLFGFLVRIFGAFLGTLVGITLLQPLTRLTNSEPTLILVSFLASLTIFRVFFALQFARDAYAKERTRLSQQDGGRPPRGFFRQKFGRKFGDMIVFGVLLLDAIAIVCFVERISPPNAQIEVDFFLILFSLVSTSAVHFWLSDERRNGRLFYAICLSVTAPLRHIFRRLFAKSNTEVDSIERVYSGHFTNASRIFWGIFICAGITLVLENTPDDMVIAACAEYQKLLALVLSIFEIF